MKREANIDYARTHDLTIEEVKACPSFAHFTDSQALEVIETLKKFTKIAYDYYKNPNISLENCTENRILKSQSTS